MMTLVVALAYMLSVLKKVTPTSFKVAYTAALILLIIMLV